MALFAIKTKKLPKFETMKYSFELRYTLFKSLHQHNSLVCWYLYRQKQFLKGRVCFNIEEGLLLKERIFFSLKVAPMRIENNFKRH